MQNLIRISQSLLLIAEKETQALLLGDMLAFSILQYEKEKVTDQYAQTSLEFRNRLEEFRGADRSLLNRLEKIQKDLGDIAKSNNLLIDQVHQRASVSAMNGLRAAQDAASRTRVKFDQPAAEGAQS